MEPFRSKEAKRTTTDDADSWRRPPKQSKEPLHLFTISVQCRSVSSSHPHGNGPVFGPLPAVAEPGQGSAITGRRRLPQLLGNKFILVEPNFLLPPTPGTPGERRFVLDWRFRWSFRTALHRELPVDFFIRQNSSFRTNDSLGRLVRHLCLPWRVCWRPRAHIMYNATTLSLVYPPLGGIVKKLGGNFCHPLRGNEISELRPDPSCLSTSPAYQKEKKG